MQTQVIHIPLLNSLSNLFQITYLCDVSPAALQHSLLKSPEIPQTPPPPSASPSTSTQVDLVLIATSHVFHARHATLALQAGKYVCIEKPIALTLQDTDAIIAADAAAGGDKVFIGYMRRYAAAFVDVVKEVNSTIVGGEGQIRYARVRDITGSNSVFVSQSGTYPGTFNDYRHEDSEALRIKTASDMHQALEVELGIPLTKQTELIWEVLSTLVFTI